MFGSHKPSVKNEKRETTTDIGNNNNEVVEHLPQMPSYSFISYAARSETTSVTDLISLQLLISETNGRHTSTFSVHMTLNDIILDYKFIPLADLSEAYTLSIAITNLKTKSAANASVTIWATNIINLKERSGLFSCPQLTPLLIENIISLSDLWGRYKYEYEHDTSGVLIGEDIQAFMKRLRVLAKSLPKTQDVKLMYLKLNTAFTESIEELKKKFDALSAANAPKKKLGK